MSFLEKNFAVGSFKQPEITMTQISISLKLQKLEFHEWLSRFGSLYWKTQFVWTLCIF